MEKLADTESLTNITIEVMERAEWYSVLKVQAEMDGKRIDGRLWVTEDRGPPESQFWCDGIPLLANSTEKLAVELIEKMNQVMHPVYVAEVNRIMEGGGTDDDE